MKLSVVIAAYDEVENVEPLLRRLERTLTAMPEVTPEAIFVVEGRDGTREALARLAARLPWVRILYNESPSGLGAAFRRGFAAVSEEADYVVTLDADLNHQPEEIPRLLEAAVSRGCDVLVGSRFVTGSEVEGTPAWKRLLSRGVNGLMYWLYGLEVRDKTSGFRIYRAEVLRELSYRNEAFAFLPELLVEASRAGYRIAEEPIRFTFRHQGRSKMDFWPTSWSYLTLLWRRFDRWSWAVAALFVSGWALRLALAYPIHKCPADADCILTGLCAFRVLRGEAPVFLSYFRIGSLGGHLAALLFLIGGVSRQTLILGPVIVGGLLMVVWYLFMRAIFDRRTAAVALVFIAVPAPAFLFWLSMPNGYPEIVFLCAATLWLAARAVRSQRRKWPFFTLGLSAGLGLWSSLLSLGCSAAAFLWIFFKRPRVLVNRALLPLIVAGFVIGASPWLAFNLRYHFPSLRSNFAAQVTPGLQQGIENLAYFASYKIPDLVASADARFRPRENQEFSRLQKPVLAVHAAAVVLFFYLLGRNRKTGRLRTEAVIPKGSPRWIFALVLVTMVALNVFSAAGMARGPTVRYVLPLYLIVPGLLAVLLRGLASRTKTLAAGLAAVILVFNLAGLYLPWTAERRIWQKMAAHDDGLVDLLEQEGVDAVLGDFWLVYPINFFSHERVKAVPLNPEQDHYRIFDQLDGEARRWALLVWLHEEPALSRWLERVGLEGEARRIGRQRLVFLIRDPLPGKSFVEQMREDYGR